MTRSVDEEEPPNARELEELYARVREDVDRERGVRAWLRSSPTWIRGAVVGTTAAVAIAAPWAMMGAPPLSVRCDGWTCSVIALGVLLAVAVAASVRPLHRASGGVGTRLWLASLGAASLVAMLMANDGSVGPVESIRCLVLGAAVGVPVWIVGFLTDRYPQGNVTLGGAVAALGGMLAAQILCPLRGVAHIVVDHFGALLLLAAIFGAGRWVLARLERQATRVE